jgi:hypothetical protein
MSVFVRVGQEPAAREEEEEEEFLPLAAPEPAAVDAARHRLTKVVADVRELAREWAEGKGIVRKGQPHALPGGATSYTLSSDEFKQFIADDAAALSALKGPQEEVWLNSVTFGIKPTRRGLETKPNLFLKFADGEWGIFTSSANYQTRLTPRGRKTFKVPQGAALLWDSFEGEPDALEELNAGAAAAHDQLHGWGRTARRTSAPDPRRPKYYEALERDAPERLLAIRGDI